MKKFECQLCGGTIRNGCCQLCGWRNQNSKEYLLNESACDDRPLTHVHKERDSAFREKKEKESIQNTPIRKAGPTLGSVYPKGNAAKEEGTAGGFQNTIPWNIPRSAVGNALLKKSLESRGRKKKQSGLWIVIMMFFVVGIAQIWGEISQKKEEHVPTTAYEDIISNQERVDDAYTQVDAKLPRKGDVWSREFDAGFYEVGTDIPVGSYKLSVVKGWGTFGVEDRENGIYYTLDFDEEDFGEQSSQEIDGIDLHQGGRVDVRGALTLRLETKKGQTQELTSVPNPLTQEVGISKDQTLIAGEDFPEGLYDMVFAGEFGIFVYEVPMEDLEDIYGYDAIIASRDYGDGETYICRNIWLPYGTKVTAEEEEMVIRPSERGSTEQSGNTL